MSSQVDPRPLRVEEFAAQCREALVPVSSRFSYFQACPLGEEDVRDYVDEPLAALPPKLVAALPPFSVVLVPYLEKPEGKEKSDSTGPAVAFERPPENRQSAYARTSDGGRTVLLFAIRDRSVADYHYYFYRAVAELAAEHCDPEIQSRFYSLLREELRNRVHGEVDQDGWRLKENLMRRGTKLRRETKAFLEYAHQALADTLALYLHGICCDIDIEPGPRQLPSRYLRRRLKLLEEAYPPPEGYAVFPEELSQINGS